jgi:hypothetical protein
MNKILGMDPGSVFTRRDAIAAGWSRHQIEWALKSRRWLALRRGVYCLRELYDAAEPTERHLLLGRAALLAHDDRHVLSHLSAALSYGLPAPLGDLGRPSLTRGERLASTDRQDDLVVQAARLRGHETVAWQGLRRTTATRTVADCLRHLAAPDGVPIADAAIHAGLTTMRAVSETLATQQGWPYLARGQEALALVDGRRETWLESYSFVTLYRSGIPLPTPQVLIYDSSGGFIGRVDGLWADHGTVCEADGRTKYALAELEAVAHATSGDLAEARVEARRRALSREKEREDRLRDTGLEVVRWGTADVVRRRARLLARIRAAWDRGDPRRFSGSAVIPPHPEALAVESG